MSNPPSDLPAGHLPPSADGPPAARSGYVRLFQPLPQDHRMVNQLRAIFLAQQDAAPRLDRIRQYLRLEPTCAEAHCDLGHGLRLQDKFEEAAAAFREALALRPGFVEALCAMAEVFAAQNKLDEAVAAYRQAIALQPDLAEAFFNLGNVLCRQKELYDRTIAYRYERRLPPDFAASLQGLDAIFAQTDKLAEAVAAYWQALALQPDHVGALCALANALQAQDKPDQAAAAYRRAIALQPDDAVAHCNLGMALQAQNKLDEALAAYHQAAVLTHGDPHVQLNEAVALLGAGQFRAGWQKYEYRWCHALREKQRHFAQPLWRGETDLRGRTILLHAEQGLGDALQLVRYAPLVAARGATVYLEVPPSLQALCAGLPGIAAVFAAGSALPPFELHCPLMSLPLAFGTELDSIPAAVPYLQAPAERRQRWAESLAPTAGPRIGVVWSGGWYHPNRRHRNIPLATFQALFDLPVGHFFILQKQVKPEEAAQLAAFPGITDLSAQLHDFADTAAVVENLDLVISADTSVAHLAGALGRPTWILLPYAAEWRWLVGREDSPWYPTARLFRQPAIGDWPSVFDRLRPELARFRG
jgi:tetratricopeptide (TPR) repeat protein